MHPAGTGLLQRRLVLRCPVSPVALEAISGVLRGEGAHSTVPQDLCNHARSRHRSALFIRPWETFYPGAKLQVPVREHASAVLTHAFEGAAQGLLIRSADTVE